MVRLNALQGLPLFRVVSDSLDSAERGHALLLLIADCFLPV